MSSSSGPVTVITGGGRGIGAVTALHLAKLGHAVVLSYLEDHAAAEQAVDAVRAVGSRAAAVPGDVADPDAVNTLFATAATLGPVTGLVNNAGLTAHIGDLADTPVEVVRRVVEVNLLGTLLCARRAAQVMSTTRGGRGGAIVNVSSAAATLGSAHEYVHYAAAKAGVEALTVGLAKELAEQGVRVNAVAPGIVRTAIHAAAGDPGRLERIVPRIPMGRVGEPEEIASAIAWLLGPEAGYVTGDQHPNRRRPLIAWRAAAWVRRPKNSVQPAQWSRLHCGQVAADDLDNGVVAVGGEQDGPPAGSSQRAARRCRRCPR